MARGQLRVYLGSAPGVGKTYRMLDEGYRRRTRGTDVVVGYVETHHRPLTDAQLRDLEVVPRVTREYRGTQLEEMDVEALLARRPEVALVDELAHTNVPGGAHEKRWQDVEVLLEAGIDVITTVNIQHLESVNDVVEKITGVTQHETVPDAFVRRAEQIELVDVTPEALRRRMAHGNIYSADKVDASLSNYFRVGNLSALRELALLWLADRVEDALQRYQDDHDINETWETRERLIVGVTGSDVDEVLLRRAARIASRTGAKIVAVHVVKADSSHAESSDTSIARALVEEFEGTFQEIVDDNPATAIVSFARSERGTQIVLGASRPRSILRPLGGVVEHVLRHSRDLDVHVIAVGGQRPRHVHRRRRARSFTWSRRLVAFALTAAALPLVTLILTAMRSSISLSTEFLAYLIVVLALTTFGGAVVGVVAALAASGLENFYFVAPLHTLAVSRPDNVVALVAFLVFALGASGLVSRFQRRSFEAERARAEAQILAQVVATVGTSHDDLLPLLDALRAVFDASSVAVLHRVGELWRADVVSGETPREASTTPRFDINEDYALTLEGVSLDGEGRQLVAAFAGRIAASLRVHGVVHDAEALRSLAQIETARSALWRTLAKELRRSLALFDDKVAVVLDGGSTAPALVQRDRLVAVRAEVRSVAQLLDNVVDAGRLEAGLVQVEPASISLADLVTTSITRVALDGPDVVVDVPENVPVIVSDSLLLSRVVSIIVGNALRYSPSGRAARITAGVAGSGIELLVIDRGPGLSLHQQSALTNVAGRDIGLSVAKGFLHLLGGSLRFEDTPGGGLTVVVQLPLRLEVDGRAARTSATQSSGTS